MLSSWSRPISGRTWSVPPIRAAGIRGGELHRRVEIVGLVEQVAADCLLEFGERSVGRERHAVLDPDGGRHLGLVHPYAGVAPGVRVRAP